MIRLILLSFVLICSGCATTNQSKVPSADEKQALKAVAASMTGKEVTDEDIKKLEERMKKDPETHKAVETLQRSINPAIPSIKYCPIDGARFSSRLEICPDHHVRLKPLDE